MGSMEIEFINPRDVKKIISGASLSWIYKNWEHLGGIKIGGRKLIAKEVLHASLQQEREVASQGNHRKENILSNDSRDGAKKLFYQKGGPEGRGRVEKKGGVDERDINRHGLLDSL